MLEFLMDENVKMVIIMTITIPLSHYLKNISSVQNRRIFSVVVGTILQFLVYGILPIIKIIGFSYLTYAIVRYYPQRCGPIVTIVSMLFLSYYHLYGLILRYGQNTMDQGVLVMINVCKYSFFAYACQDGKDPKAQLSKQKQNHMIKQTVTFWQYFQYLQFLPTAVVGPPLQYYKFEKYIERKDQFSQIPSSKNAMIQNLKQFLTCGLLYGISIMLVPTSRLNEDSFLDNSAIYVFIYTVLAIIGLRFRYFTAWKLGMFSVHSSGISYLQSKDNFHGVNHCNALIVETTPHIKDRISNWNMTVQQWLRKCVYERSPFKNKMYSSLYVFMVSAFWHGYYAGYYITFFMWFVQVYLQTQIFKFMDKGNSDKLRSIHKNPPFILRLLAIILSNSIFTHNGSFFYLLKISSCLALMHKMLYLPQILPIVGVIIFTFLQPKRQKADKKKIQ